MKFQPKNTLLVKVTALMFAVFGFITPVQASDDWDQFMADAEAQAKMLEDWSSTEMESTYSQSLDNSGQSIQAGGTFDSEQTDVGISNQQTDKFWYHRPRNCIYYHDEYDSPTEVKTAGGATLQIFCVESNTEVSALVCFKSTCAVNDYYEIFIPVTVGKINTYKTQDGEFSVMGPCENAECDGALLTEGQFSASSDDQDAITEDLEQNSETYAQMKNSDDLMVDAQSWFDYESVLAASQTNAAGISSSNPPIDQDMMDYFEETVAIEEPDAETQQAMMDQLYLAGDAVEGETTNDDSVYAGEAMQCKDDCCQTGLSRSEFDAMGCTDQEYSLSVAKVEQRSRWVSSVCSRTDASGNCVAGTAKYCVFDSERTLAFQEQGREQLSSSSNAVLQNAISWTRWSAATDSQGRSIEYPSDTIYSTDFDLAIQPVLSAVGDTQQSVRIYYQNTSEGSVRETRLPLEISESSPVQLSGTTIKVFGSCASSSGLCQYTFRSNERVSSNPWELNGEPNCVGFSAAQMAVLDTDVMDLPAGNQEDGVTAIDNLHQEAEVMMTETQEVDMVEFSETGDLKADSPRYVPVMQFDQYSGKVLKINAIFTYFWPYRTEESDRLVQSIVIDWGNGERTQISRSQLTEVDGYPAYKTSYQYAKPATDPLAPTKVVATFTVQGPNGQETHSATAYIENYATYSAEFPETGLGESSAGSSTTTIEIMDSPRLGSRE